MEKLNRWEKDNILNARLEKNVIEAIKERHKDNVWIYKPSKNDGCVPDIILCFFGHFIALDIRAKSFKKSEYDRDVDAPDKKILGLVNLSGGTGFIGRSKTSILERLEKILDVLLWEKISSK